MNNGQLRIQDLLDDPEARVPVVLVLDNSGSMLVTADPVETEENSRYITLDGKTYRAVETGRTRLDVLQEGLNAFYDALWGDENGRYAVEIAVVTIADTPQVLSDFTRIERDGVRIPTPQLQVGNNTALGAGVNLALDLLEKRKTAYKGTGVPYYQPWLVLMTDGEDNGKPEEVKRAAARIAELTEHPMGQKLVVFPFCMSKKKGPRKRLSMLSPRQPLMHLETTDMRGIFQWLGASTKSPLPELSETMTTLRGFDVEAWEQSL